MITSTEVYSEPCLTLGIRHFAKLANGLFSQNTIFPKQHFFHLRRLAGFWIHLCVNENFSHEDLTRSSPPEVFLGKCVMKIWSKFTGEYPCRSAISLKLLCNFIEIALWHGCSPVNLLYIFRTIFPKSTSEWLCLSYILW